MAEISDRWKAVIRHYLDNGFHKTKAYEAVYGPKKGENVNAQSASRLFRKEKFRAALDKELAARCMSQPEALARLAAQAESHSEKIAQGALDKILRAHGAYVDRREISGPDGGPIALEWED